MKQFWIINLVLFQLSWLCAAFFTPYANLVIPLVIVVHFYLSPSLNSDLRLLMLLPVGVIADALQIQLGVFNAGTPFFPPWLLMIWVMFIVSLNHSLRWLDNCSSVVLIIIGSLGGASSYWGAMKAGVLIPMMDDITLLPIAMVWGVLLPIFVKLKRLSVLRHSSSNEV